MARPGPRRPQPSAHCPVSAGPDQEDQLLWRPGTVLESRVAEYLVEASLRTGGEKAAARGAAGAPTRDNEQVGRCHARGSWRPFFSVISLWFYFCMFLFLVRF